MNSDIERVLGEIRKVIKGKDDVILHTIMAILVDGHILLDDIPGVGKTTLAVTLGKTLGLKYNRIQFTPDVLPSDIVGFSMYNKALNEFSYIPGAVNGVNILLGDEINRTSSKTQSALLEAMEERQVTVDGKSYPLETPFVVIATQNNVGAAGTQLLPYAQLDRFLIKLTIGYPDFDSQLEIIKDRQTDNPIDFVKPVLTAANVLRMQHEVRNVTVSDEVLNYINRLVFATREIENIEVGVSPRGAIALCSTAKAKAYISGRSYVVPEDVIDVFTLVCSHRIVLSQKARFSGVDSAVVLMQAINNTPLPNPVK
ncbi:MAG: MoxR family ATPase [Clostridia bacterium]|jgi:MoxR-like ATPase|nr:MoxR family ATPase [Clostridia bacterium]